MVVFSDNLQPVLGRTLRKLRNEHGLSLAEVAERTGISVSFLSLVETGKSDITVSRLIRLVSLYEVSLSDLVEEHTANDSHVIRRGSEIHVPLKREGIDLYLLTPNTRRAMMPIIAVYGPHCEATEYAEHPGEEFAWVLEGVVEIDFEGRDSIILNAGDAAYFDSSRPHRYRNRIDSETRVLSVGTPPSL